MFMVKYVIFAVVSLFIAYIITQLTGLGGKAMHESPLLPFYIIGVFVMPTALLPFVFLIWLLRKIKKKIS